MSTKEFGHSLQTVRAALGRCVRCGECRTVCPVFRELAEEKYSNRGRVALLRAAAEGNLPHSPGLADVVDNCIGCLACSRVCASGVDTHYILCRSREASPGGEKRRLPKRLAYRARAAPRALRRAARLQRVFCTRVA